jgi:hypothetical protein
VDDVSTLWRSNRVIHDFQATGYPERIRRITVVEKSIRGVDYMVEGVLFN